MIRIVFDNDGEVSNIVIGEREVTLTIAGGILQCGPRTAKMIGQCVLTLVAACAAATADPESKLSPPPTKQGTI